MDGLTLLGLLVAFGAIFFGQMLEGGSIHSLINISAFLIVIGGTLGAVMVQTPWRMFKHAFGVLPWVLFPPRYPFDDTRNKLIELARKARQFGLLTLEEHMDRESNALLRQGIELLIIGVDKTSIRQILEDEMSRQETHDNHAAHVFESMGGYSPTVGILGAVLGLIQVMRNLSDPSHLGEGIAVAFVATIYGVGVANLLLLPIASKIKNIVEEKVQHEEMIIEGIVSMASGESPNMLSLKLANYGGGGHARTTKKEAANA